MGRRTTHAIAMTLNQKPYKNKKGKRTPLKIRSRMQSFPAGR
jgi:hypothetical protein